MIVQDSHSSQVHTKNGKQHGSNSKGILGRADFPQHLQSSEQRQTPQSHRDILEAVPGEGSVLIAHVFHCSNSILVKLQSRDA